VCPQGAGLLFPYMKKAVMLRTGRVVYLVLVMLLVLSVPACEFREVNAPETVDAAETEPGSDTTASADSTALPVQPSGTERDETHAPQNTSYIHHTPELPPSPDTGDEDGGTPDVDGREHPEQSNRPVKTGGADSPDMPDTPAKPGPHEKPGKPETPPTPEQSSPQKKQAQPEKKEKQQKQDTSNLNSTAAQGNDPSASAQETPTGHKNPDTSKAQGMAGKPDTHEASAGPVKPDTKKKTENPNNPHEQKIPGTPEKPETSVVQVKPEKPEPSEPAVRPAKQDEPCAADTPGSQKNQKAQGPVENGNSSEEPASASIEMKPEHPTDRGHPESPGKDTKEDIPKSGGHTATGKKK